MIQVNAGEFVRTKLEETLAAVMEKPLVMVIAPSGYGKSTLVRQFFEKRHQLEYLWFPMHSEEADESWIWKRVCNKLCEHNEELREKVAEIEMPSSSQEIAYAVKLLKKYLHNPIWLVLDDYQEYKGMLLNHILEEIMNQVEYFHIILISRTYPEIAYEEMLLKGYCEVINQYNLTLNKEETDEIFRKNQIQLSPQELEQLYAYTDGWISAVYLSLYEYKKRGRLGSFVGVNHLLKTAIFDKLMPSMQEFYSKISLFDWFDIEGASYVTEMEVSETTLFECMEQFGFVHYDSTTRTFVMHALLRAVAEKELRHSDIDITRLYQRAGEWAERKKSDIVAIKNYQKAKNWEKVASLYAGENGRRVMEQAPEIFEEVREAIWPYIWDKYIMALLNHLYFLSTQEPAGRVIPLYQRIMYDIENSDKWKNDKHVKGEMLVIRASLEFNAIDKMKETLHEACQLLGYRTSSLLGNVLLTYGTTCMTLLYYRESGKLKEVIAEEKEYARYYMHLTSGGQEGWDEFFDAEYAMLTGDMDMAYSLAEKVCQQTLLRQQTCIVVSCYYVMLKCLIYQGKKAEFEQKMQEMNKQLEGVVNPILMMDKELVEGYMYACLGQKEKMPEWLQDFKLENCSRAIRNIRSGCMTYGKLLCTEEKWELLDMVGDQMLVPYEDTVHIHSRIVGCLYKAIARYQMKQPKQAVAYLKEAAALAEPDNVRSPFRENAKELQPILETLWSNPFLDSMREEMKKQEKGVQAVRGEAQPLKQEGKLTDREQELMSYVRQGKKNAEIAKQMHLAQITVEKSLTNIYRKLGVTNRTAAILKWEEIGKKN